MPNLYIIAGCNGAGKTTASYTILPNILNCKEFINADEIARGISPFQPEKAAIAAGRIMLERIIELMQLNIDFAIETTLTTKSYLNTINIAQAKGYTVTLVYFWLNDVQLAIDRVKTRVKEGGHHIAEDVIVRRYNKGLKNLIRIFIPLCDSWAIIDNSDKPYNFIAEGNKNSISIYIPELWDRIKS